MSISLRIKKSFSTGFTSYHQSILSIVRLGAKMLLFLLFQLLWSSSSLAQIKTSASSSHRWWNDISQSETSYQAKKKAIRDSLKDIRQLDRYYERKTDSLFLASHQAHLDKVPTSATDTTYNSPLQAQYEHYEALYLNKSVDKQWPADSHSQSAALPIFKQPSSTEWIENTDLYSTQIKELASLQTQHDQILEQQGQIDGYQDQVAYGQEQIEGADLTAASNKPTIGRNSILKLTKVQTVAQNTSLNGVENTIKKYKNKYESLGSMKDIGQIKTRNSMASIPFKRRLKLGGSLQFRHDQYLDIDFSPSIAYRWTRRWSTGVGFVYRAEFGNGKEWYKALDSKTYGGRFFTEYGLIKSFYAHAESETMVSRNSDLTQGANATTWGLMAGIGKTFSITGNLRGNLLLQYNFTYEKTSLIYSSPWVLRLGFEIHNLEKLFPTNKKGSTHE